MISIQASNMHYSMPKETLPDAHDYDAFEVAVYKPGTNSEPRKFIHTPYCRGLEHDLEVHIASYLPAERVQEIVDKYAGV